MTKSNRPVAATAGRLAIAGPAGEEALQALMEMIRSRALGPGDRLPTERQLALDIGLSRNTVREALRALELMGVLDVRRGDGIYVSSLEPAVLLRATTFVVELLRDHSTIEIFEVRAVLESAAAQMAAISISVECLRELEQALDHFGDERWSRQWLEADIRFHSLVASASGNDVLASLLRSLSANTYEIRHLQGETHPDDSVHSALQQHRRIYEAIARRDPIGAGYEAGAHVSATAGWLRRLRGAGVEREARHGAGSSGRDRRSGSVLRPTGREGAALEAGRVG